MIEQYRFDRVYGKVYEYCSEQRAYLFCGIIHPEETESNWIEEAESDQDCNGLKAEKDELNKRF